MKLIKLSGYIILAGALAVNIAATVYLGRALADTRQALQVVRLEVITAAHTARMATYDVDDLRLTVAAYAQDGPRIALTGAERERIASIAQRETGGADLTAAALVAECIYNGILSTDLTPMEFIQYRQYSLGAFPQPSETVRAAVAMVFDYGCLPERERIEYYYNPDVSRSAWHESLGEPVLEYGGHKYYTAVRGSE
jgi:hypothetical protein